MKEVRPYITGQRLKFRVTAPFDNGLQAVITPGYDWSGEMWLYYASGKYQIWHKEPGTRWAGIALPRDYVPSQYWLVEVEDQEPRGPWQYAMPIRVLECGHQWRAGTAELFKEIKRRKAADGRREWEAQSAA